MTILFLVLAISIHLVARFDEKEYNSTRLYRSLGVLSFTGLPVAIVFDLLLIGLLYLWLG